MQKLVGQVRRCMEDYDMIRPGDTVAVGVSGGKDSLGLLVLLNALRPYYPVPFSLHAITLDLGFGGMDFSPVGALCEEMGVPYTVVKTQIGPLIFEARKESNPCSLCARMRRGALNEAILDLGIRKIALGHHMDDAVETFLLSLLYEGRLSCFQPVTLLDRSGVTQIRPLLYIGEKALEGLAEREGLPVVESTCPADRHTRREDVKDLIRTLSGQYPDLKSRIFGSMQRLPLPAWGVERDGRKTPSDRNRSKPDGPAAPDRSEA